MGKSKNYIREKVWKDLYNKYNLERDENSEYTDLRGFAELFRERGMKGFDPKEKGDFEDLSNKLSNKLSYPEEPQDKLDLHGFTTDEAQKMIRDFILSSRQKGLIFLTIVTGKGLNSQGGVSKLRPCAVEVLNDMKREMLIKHFARAENRHGGFGALYVYIK